MQIEELEKYILTAIREIEQEKLFYYLLAKSNEQPVLIIKSPADNTANKRFLGYEWSSRKGDEGIKYIGSATKSEGRASSLSSRVLTRSRRLSLILVISVTPPASIA